MRLPSASTCVLSVEIVALKGEDATVFPPKPSSKPTKSIASSPANGPGPTRTKKALRPGGGGGAAAPCDCARAVPMTQASASARIATPIAFDFSAIHIALSLLIPNRHRARFASQSERLAFVVLRDQPNRLRRAVRAHDQVHWHRPIALHRLHRQAERRESRAWNFHAHHSAVGQQSRIVGAWDGRKLRGVFGVRRISERVRSELRRVARTRR